MNNFKRDSRPYTKNRGGFGGGGRDGERPTMHKATCVRCENACEVPFKPNGSKPIFCKDCFGKDAFGNGESRGRSFGDRDRGGDRGDRRPAFGGGADIAAVKEELKAVNKRLDAILTILGELQK